MGTSGLGLRLGLVELRRRLGAVGGVEFGVRADAAWTELPTGASGESVDGQTAAVNRARVGGGTVAVGVAHWGDGAAGGGGGLGQEQLYRRHLPGAMRDDWQLHARGGYGMRLPSGRLLARFGSLGHSSFGRRIVVGGQVGVLD